MTETDWTVLAEEYTKRDFPRKDWTYGYKPVLELLGNLQGKKVLDYGCGSGKFSRALANRGTEVIAVDPTEKMLELARTQNCQGIEYRKIVNNDISFIDSMDDAVATYVLCGRKEDKEVLQILKQIYEKLLRNGSLIVLDPHPTSRLGVTEGEPVRVCLEGMQNLVFDYWRPVKKYLSLLRDGGFSIDTLLEPQDKRGEPQMLIIRGRKCTA